ncbi:HAMP domain-containing sensor histidine kinase [Pseudoalteromonas sp. APC 3250]|uniref:sensor histidine kinase n=1 Tax=Pseudoalteromonas sp. APC 3250 TaxID=3035184 RepID=UPI0025B3E6E9|nr:HAMP domain-containing sensor histidine kinase [Pseudoalteromonas sp. APC 3250]MDN3412585.1 HAMP domain-containing sensor histidine kinase [Pseudoalteromonas sp. APC 3250]
MNSLNSLPVGSKKSVLLKSSFSLFITLFIGWLIYEQTYQEKINTIKAKQDEKLVLISGDFSKELSSIKKLTRILAQGPILKSDTPNKPLQSKQRRDEINNYFLNFAAISTNIAQIRWLDTQGQEQYRINAANGIGEIVSPDELQNKQTRYYFQKGMQVSAPDIFATEIDLNIERNQIVMPHQPTIRVTYRTDKENYLLDGLLVVNFNLDYLFDQIKSYNQESTLISILNHDGFWLLNPDAELEWGFMYGKNEQTLALKKPELWQQIIDGNVEYGSHFFNHSLYTYRRFSIFSLREKKGRISNADKELIILISSPNELLITVRNAALRLALICSGLLCLISFGFIYREYKFQNQLLALSHKLHIEKIELDIVNRELDATIKQQQQLQEGLIEAQKLSSLGLLVAGVAHEMNTPIGGAVISVSNADMALNKLNEAMKQGLTKSTLESTTTSIGENLALAKVNLNKTAVLVKSFKKMAIDRHNDEFIVCDIEKIIEELLLSLNSRLKNSPIKVKTVFLLNKQVISLPGIISQVVENLVVNALNHAFDEKQEGVIEIKVEQATNNSVRLSVSDNGKGVDGEIKADIFEPFYTTARGKGNTGLGLYMVYQWVTQILKGDIKLHSEPQSDTYFKTQFIITLPGLKAKSHYD